LIKSNLIPFIGVQYAQHKYIKNRKYQVFYSGQGSEILE